VFYTRLSIVQLIILSLALESTKNNILRPLAPKGSAPTSSLTTTLRLQKSRKDQETETEEDSQCIIAVSVASEIVLYCIRVFI